MRLYRVKNTSASYWIFADDYADAIEVAWRNRLANKRHNLSVKGEYTTFYPDTDIASVTVKGLACVWHSGLPGAKGVWLVSDNGKQVKGK